MYRPYLFLTRNIWKYLLFYLLCIIIIYCNIANSTYDMHLFYTYLLPQGDFERASSVKVLAVLQLPVNPIETLFFICFRLPMYRPYLFLTRNIWKYLLFYLLCIIIIYCNIANSTYDMHLFYTYLLPQGDFERALFGHGLLFIILLQKPYNSLFRKCKT